MYSLENFLGNKLVVKNIKNSISANRVSHAYIVEGGNKAGKKTIAKIFSKAMQCQSNEEVPCNMCTSCKTVESGNNPDIIFVKPTKTISLGVSDIRTQINSIVEIKPYNNKYKIFIVENCENMTVEAQNSLLKTLEEPPPYAIFLLLTNNSNTFLPTILSRAIVLKLQPLLVDEIKFFLTHEKNLSIEEATLYANYANGSLGKALQLCEDEEFSSIREALINIIINLKNENLVDAITNLSFFVENKQRINDILDIMLIWFRDLEVYKITNNENNLFQLDFQDKIKAECENFSIELLIKKINIINETKILLKKNVNFNMVMENMLLKLKEN